MPKAAHLVGAISSVSVLLKDLELFAMIYHYGSCGIAHLLSAFWPRERYNSDWTRRSAGYRRIHQLALAGYLRVQRLPALSGIGSGPSLVSLGSKGMSALSEYLGVARSELRRQLRVIESPFPAGHHLAACDVRQAIELACQRSQVVDLVDWVRVPPLVKVEDPAALPLLPLPPKIPLLPDGEFALAFRGGSAAYRLEVDMGTIPKRLKVKLRGYLAYAHQDDRVVLWVVPDAQRLQAIASWAQEEAQRLGLDPTLLWLTTRDQVTPETVFGPIFQVVGGPSMGLIPQELFASPPPLQTDRFLYPTLRGEVKPWRY